VGTNRLSRKFGGSHRTDSEGGRGLVVPFSAKEHGREMWGNKHLKKKIRTIPRRPTEKFQQMIAAMGGEMTLVPYVSIMSKVQNSTCNNLTRCHQEDGNQREALVTGLRGEEEKNDVLPRLGKRRTLVGTSDTSEWKIISGKGESCKCKEAVRVLLRTQTQASLPPVWLHPNVH